MYQENAQLFGSFCLSGEGSDGPLVVSWVLHYDNFTSNTSEALSSNT